MRHPDPQKVGEWLLLHRQSHPSLSLHEVADMIPWEHLPEVDKSRTMVTDSVLQYQTELRERAAAGDKYALGVLSEGRWDEPIDS